MTLRLCSVLIVGNYTDYRSRDTMMTNFLEKFFYGYEMINAVSWWWKKFEHERDNSRAMRLS